METTLKLNKTHPDIAAEWNYAKNGSAVPSNFTAGSAKDVWWVCKLGHEYHAQIKSRTHGKKHGTGCPYCKGLKVWPGFNDLKSQNPALAQEFDEEKNGITADTVHQTSQKKYFWKCEKGHGWPARVDARVRGSGCPYCSGRYATPENCLRALNPALAAELHPTKNKEWNADNLTSQSNEKVWWLCGTCGHEWEGTVNNRAKNKGCPRCAKERRKTSAK